MSNYKDIKEGDKETKKVFNKVIKEKDPQKRIQGEFVDLSEEKKTQTSF